jgi:hypothetical protein
MHAVQCTRHLRRRGRLSFAQSFYARAAADDFEGAFTIDELKQVMRYAYITHSQGVLVDTVAALTAARERCAAEDQEGQEIQAAQRESGGSSGHSPVWPGIQDGGEAVEGWAGSLSAPPSPNKDAASQGAPAFATLNQPDRSQHNNTPGPPLVLDGPWPVVAGSKSATGSALDKPPLQQLAQWDASESPLPLDSRSFTAQPFDEGERASPSLVTPTLSPSPPHADFVNLRSHGLQGQPSRPGEAVLQGQADTASGWRGDSGVAARPSGTPSALRRSAMHSPDNRRAHVVTPVATGLNASMDVWGHDAVAHIAEDGHSRQVGADGSACGHGVTSSHTASCTSSFLDEQLQDAWEADVAPRATSVPGRARSRQERQDAWGAEVHPHAKSTLARARSCDERQDVLGREEHPYTTQAGGMQARSHRNGSSGAVAGDGHGFGGADVWLQPPALRTSDVTAGGGRPMAALEVAPPVGIAVEEASGRGTEGRAARGLPRVGCDAVAASTPSRGGRALLKTAGVGQGRSTGQGRASRAAGYGAVLRVAESLWSGAGSVELSAAVHVEPAQPVSAAALCSEGDGHGASGGPVHVQGLDVPAVTSHTPVITAEPQPVTPADEPQPVAPADEPQPVAAGVSADEGCAGALAHAGLNELIQMLEDLKALEGAADGRVARAMFEQVPATLGGGELLLSSRFERLLGQLFRMGGHERWGDEQQKEVEAILRVVQALKGGEADASFGTASGAVSSPGCTMVATRGALMTRPPPSQPSHSFLVPAAARDGAAAAVVPVAKGAPATAARAALMDEAPMASMTSNPLASERAPPQVAAAVARSTPEETSPAASGAGATAAVACTRTAEDSAAMHAVKEVEDAAREGGSVTTVFSVPKAAAETGGSFAHAPSAPVVAAAEAGDTVMDVTLTAVDNAGAAAGMSRGRGNRAVAAASEQEGLETLYQRIVGGQAVGQPLDDHELQLLRHMHVKFRGWERAWLEGAARMRDVATLTAKVQFTGILESEETALLGAALLMLRSAGGLPAVGAAAAAVDAAEGVQRSC